MLCHVHCCCVVAVMSDSFQPHGLQHARLSCPSPFSQSLLKLMSIESVMSSNHLILCYPLFLFAYCVFCEIGIYFILILHMDKCNSDRKESACNSRDPGSVPGLGRSPGEGNGKSLQYLGKYWEIPWTEEPGGLQSMGLQRVRCDLVTKPTNNRGGGELPTLHKPS